MGNLKDEMPVIVSKSEFEALTNARQKLMALEEAGVQHWSGYANAMALIDVESRSKSDSRTMRLT